jgi:hypothetical protein
MFSFFSKPNKERAYWNGTDLVREKDGKVIARIQADSNLSGLWGYRKVLTGEKPECGYVTKEYAKRGAEADLNVDVIYVAKATREELKSE